jgi:hypothetical protein
VISVTTTSAAATTMETNRGCAAPSAGRSATSGIASQTSSAIPSRAARTPIPCHSLRLVQAENSPTLTQAFCHGKNELTK